MDDPSMMIFGKFKAFNRYKLTRQLATLGLYNNVCQPRFLTSTAPAAAPVFSYALSRRTPSNKPKPSPKATIPPNNQPFSSGPANSSASLLPCSTAPDQ